MKRRSAIEASISHLKRYYRLGRNYLKGKIGDIINPILASIGYNFAKILRHLIG
jgi:IS5 family transposase